MIFNENPKINTSQQGFSLVELSLVMLILGVLITGAFSLAKVGQTQKKYDTTENKLQKIKRAMLTFSLISGHLPCPDVDANGNEERVADGVACSAVSGWVPYVDIGLSRSDVVDSWGNLISYSIDSQATNLIMVNNVNHDASYFNGLSSPGADGLSFNLSTPPTLTNIGGSTSGTLDVQNVDGSWWATNQIAILVAYNSNGATTIASCSVPNASNLETINCNGSATFQYSPLVLTNNGAFFDDILMPISATEVKAEILQNDISTASIKK